MPEGEPRPEYEINPNPYEKILLDFIDNVKSDWNGDGCKLWIVQRLAKVEAERMSDDNL